MSSNLSSLKARRQPRELGRVAVVGRYARPTAARFCP